MISPSMVALATLTLMLWIVWSDTMRARRPSPLLYSVRIALFLIVTGILLLNLLRHPQVFDTAARVITALAVAVGLGGAFYFARRLVLRR